MRSELLAGLLASAMTTPWAIRREVLDSAKAALLGGAPLLGAARFSPLIGVDLTEPVAGIQAAASDTATPAPEAAIHPATEKATARKPGGVAVIPVRGTISNRVTIFDLLFGSGVTPPGWVLQRVQRAVADDGIKAVILDFDTPGGVVTGVQEAAAGIMALRGKKPIVAQVSGQCASAGFWLAAPADDISVTATGLVGSLGVYMTHEDWSKLYEEIGIKTTYITSARYKVEGNDTEPLSDEAEAHMREIVNDYMDMFVDAVAKGRGVTPAVARGERFGEGRVYTASRAVERGMADRVRDLTGTLQAYGVDPNAPNGLDARGRPVALLDRTLRALELEHGAH